MTEKLYYWAENLEGYSSDNEKNYNQIIEIKRLNFFIGKNNAGKSRFLRNLVLNEKQISDYSFPLFKTNIEDNLISKLSSAVRTIQSRDNFSSYTLGDLTSTTPNKDEAIIRTILQKLNLSKYDKNKYITALKELHDELIIYKKDPNRDLLFKNAITEISELVNFKRPPENKNLYIPILRGMRPVTEIENKQPYIERAQKDYFTDKEKYNSSNIITGECLYYELKIHLLGEPEQREIIKSYEEKLSQYFFDNEAISLIPKHDQDVVNIKIGNDKQFPISELGDGLQQVIILTYEAFIKNDETHAFFIEEPELHMHAGMVRQLMNFYLNETSHYYFFTTHSNHLLDMADESDQVIIQKFVKEQNKDDSRKFDFKIYRCDRDRDLLASLGVKPSSVYLANCTIWVEGITDRLYITKYMEKYLSELETSNSDLYKQYRRFMPNYHYTFVEYAGSNLVHWSFSDEYADHLDDKGLSAKAVASEMLLVADGDIQDKADRIKNLITDLTKHNFVKLECKEIENTLPFESILRVAKQRFLRMKNPTKSGFTIEKLKAISTKSYFDHNEFGIGKLLDNKIRNSRTLATKTAFADGQGVGTIKYKLDFCREVIKDFDENNDWTLTPKAIELCEKIFKHIEKCNE